MRPSMTLNTARIKTARKTVGLTQMETAKLVFPNSEERTRLVTYQRIERTGKTSPTTAKKIAECLKVDVDDLRHQEGRSNMLCWISQEEDGGEDDGDNKQQGIGATHSVLSLFWELERILKEHPSQRNHNSRWIIHARCDFDGDKFHLRIGRCPRSDDHRNKENGRYWSITIRFCKFDAEIGLRWCRADNFESDFIALRIKNLLFSYADIVVMNGKSFPPIGATACYHVTAYKTLIRDGEVSKLRGEKSLMGRYYFIHSLNKWFRDNPGATVHKIANGITIEQSAGLKSGVPNANKELEIENKISVRCGWFDSHTGAFEEAPWPEYDLTKLEEGDLVCLISDWPAEDDDAEIPTFEPEMIEVGE
ncbi:MAG: helix-turn-helix transcriptional regulator [Proteobacteria bacterium]|nr:helix-turn-helix transcriptional regulator [Pseudomonadota bacterium]